MTRDVAAIRRWLAGLPVADGVSERHLDWLARQGRWASAAAGDIVHEPGSEAGTFELLVEGELRVDLCEAADRTVSVRTAGQPVSWSALIPPYQHRFRVIAETDTRLLVFDRGELEHRARDFPDELGVLLLRHALAWASDCLRTARTRSGADQDGEEAVAVGRLIADSTPALPVSSTLHKLPHQLQHPATLPDAFRTLDAISTSGDPIERSLARICADLLVGVRREMLFHRRLERIYDAVARAPSSATPERLRAENALAFADLFAEIDSVVAGWEHLPDTEGNVFLLNHLTSHPWIRLANGMFLALDSHFVASVILHGRYGRAPVRVVRQAGPAEFWQQQYYDRLGHVYATSDQADPLDHGPHPSAKELRRSLLERAAAVLRAGENLVIAPEGLNYPTEKSPGRFRPGAFLLSSLVEPEPLLVPIAVANFDKRITRVRPAVVIHEPFRLSEVVPPGDREALLAFLNGPFASAYRAWVREAAALSAG